MPLVDAAANAFTDAPPLSANQVKKHFKIFSFALEFVCLHLNMQFKCFENGSK